MADRYALEYVGTDRDGTAPGVMVDGRLVDSKIRRLRATKDLTNILAFATSDRLYLGKLPAGATVKLITMNSDTSWGTTTISIGTTATPAKYVNAATNTVTDKPVILGPLAAAADNAPLSAEEDIYVTVGIANVAAAVITVFEVEYTISA